MQRVGKGCANDDGPQRESQLEPEDDLSNHHWHRHAVHLRLNGFHTRLARHTQSAAARARSARPRPHSANRRTPTRTRRTSGERDSGTDDCTRSIWLASVSCGAARRLHGNLSSWSDHRDSPHMSEVLAISTSSQPLSTYHRYILDVPRPSLLSHFDVPPSVHRIRIPLPLPFSALHGQGCGHTEGMENGMARGGQWGELRLRLVRSFYARCFWIVEEGESMGRAVHDERAELHGEPVADGLTPRGGGVRPGAEVEHEVVCASRWSRARRASARRSHCEHQCSARRQRGGWYRTETPPVPRAGERYDTSSLRVPSDSSSSMRIDTACWPSTAMDAGLTRSCSPLLISASRVPSFPAWRPCV
ncbi:hypothetical protein B0H19DRAFT_140810 [Mycena capillaripes]|nr:hypothetical protein B0H19DRAFT_140810 [Mycena capillaripes]